MCLTLPPPPPGRRHHEQHLLLGHLFAGGLLQGPGLAVLGRDHVHPFDPGTGVAEFDLPVSPDLISLAQVVMAIYAHKRTHRLLDGMIIILFYPLALVFVALLEGVAGID